MPVDLIVQVAYWQTVKHDALSRYLNVDKLLKRTYQVFPAPNVVNAGAYAQYLHENC